MTPNKIATKLNEELCLVKHVLESAAQNGILVKVGRKFDWSYKMKYPKGKGKCCIANRVVKKKRKRIIRKCNF